MKKKENSKLVPCSAAGARKVRSHHCVFPRHTAHAVFEQPENKWSVSAMHWRLDFAVSTPEGGLDHDPEDVWSRNVRWITLSKPNEISDRRSHEAASEHVGDRSDVPAAIQRDTGR